MDEILKSRIGTNRIETRPQENTWIESLPISLFEPRHRLIPVVERLYMLEISSAAVEHALVGHSIIGKSGFANFE
jgi:hypothetical protein